MKYIPSKKQWKGWTLPSKASYFGVVLAIVLFAASIVIAIYLHRYVQESDQPKLSIRANKKPYLRYKVPSPGNIEISYEMKFLNLGKNTAVNIAYNHIIQKLSLDGKVVVEVNNAIGGNRTPAEAGYKSPPKLISGDKFFQIFQFNGKDLTKSQIENLVNRYKKDQLSIILDIEMEYDDAITHKRYQTREILNIHKYKSLILNQET
jgi:hypothetical protein